VRRGGQHVNVGLLAQVVLNRARYRRRDHWSTAELAAHQARSLSELRAWAYAESSFYARHHAGLLDAPLSELPPVTKAELMENFDAAVTAPGLHLAEIEGHLRALTESGGDPGRPWRGRWCDSCVTSAGQVPASRRPGRGRSSPSLRAVRHVPSALLLLKSKKCPRKVSGSSSARRRWPSSAGCAHPWASAAAPSSPNAVSARRQPAPESRRRPPPDFRRP